MAVKNVRAAPLPLPPENYSPQYMQQFIRVVELYFNQLDSFAPNQAESYTAENFYGGAFSESSASFASSGSISAGTGVALADASLGAVTITLPAASLSKGLTLTIKKTDATANAVTADGSGSETIDGSATVTTTTAYGVIRLYCDGIEWWTI